jgi:hypothetical protein
VSTSPDEKFMSPFDTQSDGQGYKPPHMVELIESFANDMAGKKRQFLEVISSAKTTIEVLESTF